jgi:hypothetical protein
LWPDVFAQTPQSLNSSTGHTSSTGSGGCFEKLRE